MHALGCRSVSDLKRIIKMNSIQDCPVTTDNIDRAGKIFGPDIPSLKGKTVRRRPTPIVSNIVDIPRELLTQNQFVELCIDTLFVNSLPFLATVSKSIQFRTCDYIPNRKVGEYKTVLAKVIRQYHDAGLAIRCIYGDREYAQVLQYFKESSPPIDFNLSAAQEHVPEAERNNRVLKERMRAIFHSLPFQAIPSIFIRYLASESAEKLNFFPPIGGVSPYYSPREILSRRRLNYLKHCTIPQFSYAQAHDERDIENTQQARTIDCIYMPPVCSQQGGHVLFNLTTNRIITRRQATIVPMTTAVITMVERLAKADGMTNFVLQGRDGSKFYDSTWIEGVDYSEDDFYDDVYADEDYAEDDDRQQDVELEAEADSRRNHRYDLLV